MGEVNQKGKISKKKKDLKKAGVQRQGGKFNNIKGHSKNEQEKET